MSQENVEVVRRIWAALNEDPPRVPVDLFDEGAEITNPSEFPLQGPFHGHEGVRVWAQLAFGRTPADPFDPSTIQDRADRAWRAAGLQRITPHACRHTFASLMIAARVNAKALSTFMGHASIAITLDRYGHLMPGSETEAAELLDGYLAAQRERAEGRARAADQELTGAQSGARITENA